ncbi:MAG TPA: hypothetical protein VLE74_02105 [Candidatus Saccharimonadales bacterium]|nr:hypothetical protein [Candidatus Saccharimonadales bacterium]
MTAQEYIISTLQALKESTELTDVSSTPIEEAIFAKVMSKKFRKLKADDNVITITKKAIQLSVKDNKPIVVNVIFGGNKLWHFDEAPEIDWAELFVTTYLLRWMKSIASVYEPGARLEYYSEDVVLENMNNLPKQETDKYSDSFVAMLNWLKQYLPENVAVSYKRYGDEYGDISEYLAELEQAKAKVSKELGGKLPELDEHQREATELNVRLKPGQTDDPLWREKAELIHQSIERTKTMERYINDPSMIPSCPTYYPGCIATGSTKKSYAKFWVAVGALEHAGDSYNELVLTPKQLETAQFDWQKTHVPGLEGKNFKRIRILKEISS